MKELIRINDSIEKEYEYANQLFPTTIQLLDLNARNYFNKGTFQSMIKYSTKFNLYGMKNQLINHNIVA